MAYVSQELKAKLAPKIKAACKKYGVKASIAVRNHSTLVVNIKSGALDFIGNYNKLAEKRDPGGLLGNRRAEKSLDINQFWYQEHFDGKVKKFLDELIPAMKGPDFFDDTDVMTDYFHCSHYLDINVGQWDKPYILEK
jgi:hypothetical protein